MAQTKAWLMELDAEYFSAIGNQHMEEYIISADIEIMPVPLAPDYSPGVMLWRNQIIPVIDLVRVLNPQAHLPDEMSGVMVLAYQEAPGALLQHGAVVLRGAPQNILVDGDMACPLPAHPAAWRKLAVACISSSDKAVPILKVQSLFSSSLRRLYKENQQSGSAALTETALMQDIEASEVMVQAVNEPPVSDSFEDTDAGLVAASTLPDTQPEASMIDESASKETDVSVLPNDEDKNYFDEVQDNTEVQEALVANNDMTSEKVAEHEVSTSNPPAPQLGQSEAAPPAPEVDAAPEEHNFNGETHKDVQLIQQHESQTQSKPLASGYRNKYGPGHGQTPRTGAWRPGRWTNKDIKLKSDN